MTEQTKKKYSNIVAAVKSKRQDGQPAALIVTDRLWVNSDVYQNNHESGTYLSFYTKLTDDGYKIAHLERVLNDAQLKRDEKDSVSAKVTIRVDNPKKLAYLSERLEKGACIITALSYARYAAFKGNDGASKLELQLQIGANDFKFIETPGQKASDNTSDVQDLSDGVEETYPDLPF